MTVSVSAKRRARLSYETSPAIYNIMRWIISRLVRLLYRYEVQGQENVPLEGPAILVVNHLHLFDPVVIMPAIPRRVTPLAAAKWCKNLFIGTILKMAGVIFVRRGEVDRQALRACFDVLERGKLLAIAPEGTRSRKGSLQRAKAGVAYIATRTNALLVPVAVWGVEHLRDWKRLKRPTCHVVIGKPFRLPRPSGKATGEILQELADLVMLQIGALLPPAYRGVYAERVAALEAGEHTGPQVIPA